MRGRAWCVGVLGPVKAWGCGRQRAIPHPFLAVPSSLSLLAVRVARHLTLYGTYVGASDLSACPCSDLPFTARVRSTAVRRTSSCSASGNHDGARLPSHPRICTNHTCQPSTSAENELLT